MPVAGSRPDRLTEVRPQERVLRRTVEQNVEPVRGVPVLDAPVPQMVDQAAEVVRFFVSLPVVAEQVIEVPTIIPEDPIPQRALLRAPQLAEQLVEVPTTPGYALAVVAVQTLGWREARALLEQLAPPGHGGIQILAAATLAEVVDVSVTTQLRSSRFRRVRGGASASVHRQCGWFSSCFTETGFTVQTVQKTEIRQVQFLDWDTPVVVQRHVQMVQTVQSGGAAGAVPARLWTSLRSRRSSRSSRRSREVPQIQFIVRAGFDGSEGVFGAFLRHFSRSSGCPELSASFLQLGALDDEEFFVIEGWGVALTPGVCTPRCQATSCALISS